MENLLIYATGGLAIADTDLRVTNIADVIPGKDDQTLFGFTVGGGLEFKVSDSVSVGAEYLFADFDDEHYALLNLGGGDTASVDADLTLNIGRAFLNFRF